MENESIFDLIKSHIQLKGFMELSKDKKVNKQTRKEMLSYLKSIPSYDETKELEKQESLVIEQHGYVLMNLPKFLIC